MYFFTLLLSLMQTVTLFNAQQDSETKNWQVVDDRVMGGLSQGNIAYTEAGNLLYTGHVTTENNGGFSSVRHPLNPAVDASQNTQVVILLKGDGERYQFRLKAENGQRYSYISYFQTTGEWQDITLSLKDFYPSFRGRKLDLPNYEPSTLTEITFLIANYKEQDFKLEVEQVYLK